MEMIAIQNNISEDFTLMLEQEVAHIDIKDPSKRIWDKLGIKTQISDEHLEDPTMTKAP